MKRLLLTVLWLSMGISAMATTRYVGKSGFDGGNNCTNSAAASRCLTITRGVGQMVGGDTLIVGNGSYNEVVPHDGIPVGSSGAPTILQSETLHGAAVQPLSSETPIYIGTGSAWIVIDGFDLNSEAVMNSTVYLGNSTNTVIKHNLIHGAHLAPDYASCILGGASTLIWDNDIYTCGVGSGNQGHGIYTGSASVTIQGNRISGVAGSCITNYSTGSGDTIFDNVLGPNCANEGAYSLDIYGTTHLIYNNIVYNSGTGAHVNADSVRFYNNTIYNNASGTFCIWVEGGTSNLVKNNICYLNTDNTIPTAACAVTTCQANNLLGNPNFVGAGSANFAILAGPAVGAGADLSGSFTTDITGATRTVPWDIGAYAFSGVSPPTCGSAVSHVIAQSTNTTSVTTGAITTTGANLIVLAVVDYVGAAASTISDNKSNTWTGLTSYPTSSEGRIKLYYSFAPTVGAGHTFSASNAGAAYQAIAVVALPAASSSPFDVQNGAISNAGGTTMQPGSVTPSQNNEYVVAAIATQTPATVSINSSFVLTDQASFASGLAYGLAMACVRQTTAAAANPTWTYDTASSALAADIATFKASGVIFASKSASPIGGRVGSRQITYQR